MDNPQPIDRELQDYIDFVQQASRELIQLNLRLQILVQRWHQRGMYDRFVSSGNPEQQARIDEAIQLTHRSIGGNTVSNAVQALNDIQTLLGSFTASRDAENPERVIPAGKVLPLLLMVESL